MVMTSLFFQKGHRKYHFGPCPQLWHLVIGMIRGNLSPTHQDSAILSVPSISKGVLGIPKPRFTTRQSPVTLHHGFKAKIEAHIHTYIRTTTLVAPGIDASRLVVRNRTQQKASKSLSWATTRTALNASLTDRCRSHSSRQSLNPA